MQTENEMLDQIIANLQGQRRRLKRYLRLQIEVELLARKAIKMDTTDTDLPKLMEMIAEKFEVQLSDLRSRRRVGRFIIPRHTFCFLAREFTEASLNDIGKILGGKDHGTVLHGARHCKAMIETQPQFALKISKLRDDWKRAQTGGDFSRG